MILNKCFPLALVSLLLSAKSLQLCPTLCDPGGCGAGGAACNDDTVDGDGLIDAKLLERRH